MSIIQKWKDYSPSKAALGWTAIGAGVLTIVVGFTWGGWVTGGTAQRMAEDAAAASHAELAASICVENFRSAETARAQHQEIIGLSSYRQRQFVENADWAMLPMKQKLDRRAATRCAEMIVAMDPDELPDAVSATADEPETAVQ